jgi:hypothetical protein
MYCIRPKTVTARRLFFLGGGGGVGNFKLLVHVFLVWVVTRRLNLMCPLKCAVGYSTQVCVSTPYDVRSVTKTA